LRRKRDHAGHRCALPLQGRVYGQAYFERALGILTDLDAADQAVAHLQATPRGLLRVNAPMSFGTLELGPAIADFMEQNPELQIQLVLSDDQVDPVQGGFDVSLRIADLESSSLIARKVVPIDRVICASPDYLDRNGVPTHPCDLRNHKLLTYGFLLTGNQWKLTGEDGDHWIQPAWTLCANNAEVLRDAAIRGRGVVLLPTFIASTALREGALRPFLASLGVAVDAACGLSADPASCSESAPVYRLPGRAVQRRAPVEREGLG
jgi:DNA-binding transcriptional LysR family regulator